MDTNGHKWRRLNRLAVSTEATKKPCLSGAFLKADDGTRTHDLLHGQESARGDSNCPRMTNGPVRREIGAAKRHETTPADAET
jgi:hypothetical protein